MICCGLNKMRCFILQCSTALCPSGFTCFILAVLRMSVKTFPVSTWSSCRNHIPVGNLVVQSGYFCFALSQCPFETTTFAFNVQLTVCHTGRPAFTGMLLINCVSLRGCLIVLCNFFRFVLHTVPYQILFMVSWHHNLIKIKCTLFLKLYARPYLILWIVYMSSFYRINGKC